MLRAVPHKRANAVTGNNAQTRQPMRKACAASVNLRVTAPVDLLTIVVTDATTAEMSRAEPVQRFHPKRGIHHSTHHNVRQAAYQSPAASDYECSESDGIKTISPEAVYYHSEEEVSAAKA